MAVRRLLGVALLLLAGCPHRSPYSYVGDIGDGGIDEPDAAVVTMPPDARPVGLPDAAGIPDARNGGGGGLGGFADFLPCVTDSECADGYDCRPIPWLASGAKECIPQCDTSLDCPFNTYCYPTGGGGLGPAFALMGDHCWYSLCGEAFGPPVTPPSMTGGPCELGAEAGAPDSDRLPGWCLPIDDQFFGQCLEVGDVPPGGSCELASPTRSTPNCNASSICIGGGGASTGTCARLCSPQFILTGGATGCTAAGEECYDDSRIYAYDDGTTARATIGYCTDVDACGLIGPNPCGPSSDGQAQGCRATNAVRPTGICDPAGTGGLMTGDTCYLPPAGDAVECPHGSICNPYSTATCEQICKVPKFCMVPADCPHAMTCTSYVCTLPYGTGPDNPCTGLTECLRMYWDAGFDGTFDTFDDVYTSDWGTCR